MNRRIQCFNWFSLSHWKLKSRNFYLHRTLWAELNTDPRRFSWIICNAQILHYKFCTNVQFYPRILNFQKKYWSKLALHWSWPNLVKYARWLWLVKWRNFQFWSVKIFDFVESIVGWNCNLQHKVNVLMPP